MFKFSVKGDFRRTESLLRRAMRHDFRRLDAYGRMGVEALSEATPKDSGKTAAGWSHKVVKTGKGYEIQFNNSHVNDGVKIAVILQYGHGTGTGGYVQGRDYINPAVKPVFDKIADEAWKEVIG